MLAELATSFKSTLLTALNGLGPNHGAFVSTERACRIINASRTATAALRSVLDPFADPTDGDANSALAAISNSVELRNDMAMASLLDVLRDEDVPARKWYAVQPRNYNSCDDLPLVPYKSSCLLDDLTRFNCHCTIRRLKLN